MILPDFYQCLNYFQSYFSKSFYWYYVFHIGQTYFLRFKKKHDKAYILFTQNILIYKYGIIL